MQTVPKKLNRVAGLGVVCLLCSACATVNPSPDGDGDRDADLIYENGIPDGFLDVLENPSCNHEVCDLWPQCGCQPGETCVHLDEGGRSCIEAGSISHGQVCVDEGESCGEGLICAGYTDEPSYCLQYCSHDLDCVDRGEGSRCELQFVDDHDRELGRACSSSCDPTSSSPSCAPGIQCVVFVRETTGELLTHCAGPAGSGTTGTACDLINGAGDCMSGFFCADAGDGDECIQRCTIPEGDECEGSQMCRSFQMPVVIGSIEYGYCL